MGIHSNVTRAQADLGPVWGRGNRHRKHPEITCRQVSELGPDPTPTVAPLSWAPGHSGTPDPGCCGEVSLPPINPVTVAPSRKETETSDTSLGT